MGIGRLGGIVSSILGGLMSLLMDIVMPILEIVLGFVNKWIIAPLITTIIRMVMYVLSLVFYNIAIFILALIDFVEIVFRLLAGLEVQGMSLDIGQSPDHGMDLLYQLIRTPEVRDAFLSMAIVGVFLLVITTIFQMIKVEYATEGSKNAKGPILTKAFKGLCNLILLPFMVLIGVFLGNQILDLLDKATQPDSYSSHATGVIGNTPEAKSATIAGTLFVAAAGDAHYRVGDIPIIMASSNIGIAASHLTIYLLPMIINSIAEAWGDTIAEDNGGERPYLYSDSDRDEMESMVACGHIAYWNFFGITTIYDYSKINYLLLIFGGCIVIKTLYYTCFGMIVRLYQCGMLFIISPAVIGLSPINESGFGKWRSEFIGQCISAYGVILALNIFFILVKVLLSIEMNFTISEGGAGFLFNPSMMEGLLKMIIVMGGAISIEKFSKEIGGYFGAKDALSQGKEMEKAIGDEAKKAVSGAVSVAMMATGLGGAAISSAKGLGVAMKKGSTDAKGSATGIKGAAKSAWGGLKGGAQHIGGGVKKGAGKLMDGAQYIVDASGLDIDLKDKTLDLRQRAVDGPLGLGKKKAEKSRVEYEKDKAHYAKVMEEGGFGSKEAEQEFVSQMEKKRKTAEFLEFRTKGQEKRSQKIQEEREAHEKEKADKDYQLKRSAQQQVARGAASQAAKNLFGQTIFGAAFNEGKKTLTSLEDAAAKEGGKEMTAALEHLRKIKSDEKEAKWDKRNADAIQKKNRIQEAIIKTMSIEEVRVANQNLRNSVTSDLGRLNSMQQRMETKGVSKQEKDALAHQIQQLKNALTQRLGIGFGDVVMDNKTHQYEIKGGVNFEIDEKKIEKIFEHIAKNGGMNNEQAIKDAVKEAIEKGEGGPMSADQAKMIQEIFEKVVSKYNKG